MISPHKRIVDWASRTQGCTDWSDARRRNNVWLGARIGFIEGMVITAPLWALLLVWVVWR